MITGEGGGRIGADAWSSAVEVRQLRAFLAVVECGSVSAAALALGLAQSTVSEALAALDRAAGTRTVLRKRGAHAATVTDAGEALLPHARRMLQEIDAMHLAVARVVRGAHASVEVMANESVSTYLLAPALRALRARWPQVRFSVTVGMCATVRAAVIAGQCDLGLLLEAPVVTEEPAARSAARAHRARSSVVLSPDVPLVIFGGGNHPLVRRAGALRREMLASFPLLIADSAGDFHELVRRYFAAEGLPGPKLESVGSIEGVKRGVKADASALGLLPYYAVAEDLTSKEAHALTLRPPPPHMQLIALLPSSHTGSHPVVPELIEQMRTV